MIDKHPICLSISRSSCHQRIDGSCGVCGISRTIKLVTISRISKEKGFERMQQLEALLSASGISFIWDCYGDTSTKYAKQIVPHFKTVKFKGVTHQPLQVIKQYDYLVQLSDTEGFPYSIYEAMQQKVPVIATNFPSIHEMIIDGKNGYILEMDLSNFDPDKIKTVPVIKSFTEKSNEKDWIKFLDMAKATTAAKQPAASGRGNAKVNVRVTRKYHDTKMDKELQPGFEFKASKDRASVLERAKVAVIVK